MDLTVILTGIGTIITVIGANIALITWLRSDMKSFEQEVRGWRDDINKEMKEFHTKLATQDLEFKMRIAAIEERNKN